MRGGDVLAPVGLDQVQDLGVQGQVAVLTELADRDVQPGGGTDGEDVVGGQGGVFADAQPGAQQDFDGDPDKEPPVGLGGAQQPGRGVVEGLGQRAVWPGQVPGQDRDPGWDLSSPRRATGMRFTRAP